MEVEIKGRTSPVEANPNPRAAVREDPVFDNGDYVEPSILDIPKFGDEDQYVYRWIRITIRGEDDHNNVSRRLREGWTFVKQSELPSGYHFPTVNGASSPQFDGCIRNGDVVLGKISRKKAQGYLNLVEQRTRAMAAAVSGRRIIDNDTGTVLESEGRMRVSTGNQHFER